MTLDSDLDAAAAAGIISASQAGELKRFLAARASPDMAALEATDAEAVRFARGFHDVFLSIGLVILLVGIVASTGLAVGTMAGFFGAATAWALAEYYARARLLVLPSIVLCAGFVVMVAGAAGILAGSQLAAGEVALADRITSVPVIATFAALAASGVFLARFRLPFAAGMVAATATVALVTLSAVAAPDLFIRIARPLFLLAGVTIFCAAMIYDLSDPARTSLRADKAFWLHLVAAPLIVHSVVAPLTGESPLGTIVGTDSGMTIAQAGAAVAVLAMLGLVGLIVDRRAMLVAGLAYLGVAIAVLVRGAQGEAGSVTAVTLLLLGAAVVLLGTGWRSARRAVVGALVPGRLAGHLPIIRVSPNE